MPDIELRLNKDMLVLTAPIDCALVRQGVDIERDREFITLIEPEAVRDTFRWELLAGAQCLVTNTSGITNARLAHANMEGRGSELATAALTVAQALKPQHILAEIGPSGLPLDASSAGSLKQSRDQYCAAAEDFGTQGFDAYFLNGFRSVTDIKCALMGIRKASGKPLFASVDTDGQGRLHDGRETLDEAVSVMDEFGADVVGIACCAPLEEVLRQVELVKEHTAAPLLVQLAVCTNDPRQQEPSLENPYYCPDTMVEAASLLRGAGVQFLRATGNATPAYTGALAAASTGFDVMSGQ